MANRVDLDLVLGLVDAVNHPIGSASGGVVAVKWLIQWLARPIGVRGDRAVDCFHCGEGDFQGKVLPDVAPGLAGEEHSVGFAGRRVDSAHWAPRRRRCSSSARTWAAV